MTREELRPSAAAVKAFELEVKESYYRAMKKSDVPIGVYVQQAIDAALTERENNAR